MGGIDQYLFHIINTDLSNPLFDAVLPYCREKLFWAPVYLFFLAFGFLNLGKKAWVLVLGVALTILLADFTSSQLIKKNVQRLRPCNTPALEVKLRIATCGSGYSFTSSHATNHAAVAVFLGLFFAPYKSRWLGYLLAWAALVSFAQVYVGVHFPFDVLAGYGLGLLIGWTVFWLLKQNNLLYSEHQVNT